MSATWSSLPVARSRRSPATPTSSPTTGPPSGSRWPSGSATDWKQFQSATSAGEPDGLRAALALVQGMPFGVESRPVDVGRGHLLRPRPTASPMLPGPWRARSGDGDPRLATWAARQGQLANRYDQGLWRVLLRAAMTDRHASRSGRTRALLAIDGDPAEDLEPATLDLYGSLGTPKRAASEVVVLQDDDDAILPTRRAV